MRDRRTIKDELTRRTDWEVVAKTIGAKRLMVERIKRVVQLLMLTHQLAAAAKAADTVLRAAAFEMGFDYLED